MQLLRQDVPNRISIQCERYKEVRRAAASARVRQRAPAHGLREARPRWKKSPAGARLRFRCWRLATGMKLLDGVVNALLVRALMLIVSARPEGFPVGIVAATRLIGA